MSDAIYLPLSLRLSLTVSEAKTSLAITTFLSSDMPQILITHSAVDRVVAARRLAFILGVALIVLPRLPVQQHSVGIFTGSCLVTLGIFSFALRNWRTDRGLWMLSALLLCVYGPLYIYIQVRGIAGLLNNLGPNRNQPLAIEIAKAIDSGLAILVFGLLVRFVLTVTACNWSFSRDAD